MIRRMQLRASITRSRNAHVRRRPGIAQIRKSQTRSNEPGWVGP